MRERIPSLDVVRALAILLVVNCHIATSFELGPIGAVLGLGGRGVDLFFVLSGWLLGRLLCQQFQSTGSIDVKQFWIRRWLRTLPAYYAVCALTLVQTAIDGRPLEWAYLWFGQTYATDLPYFGISWSLCVEEHFYLLIAPALLVCLRRRETAVLLFACMLLLPAAARHNGLYTSIWQTHVRLDQCAMGVLLAYVNVMHPSTWRRLLKALPILLVGSVALWLWQVSARLDWTDGLPLDPAVWAGTFGVLIILANANDRCRKFNLPGAHYLATRSYAVYLLHVEAIAITKRIGDMPIWLTIPLIWLLSLALAELLYRLVERPGMNLRDRINRQKPAQAITPLPGARARATT